MPSEPKSIPSTRKANNDGMPMRAVNFFSTVQTKSTNAANINICGKVASNGEPPILEMCWLYFSTKAPHPRSESTAGGEKFLWRDGEGLESNRKPPLAFWSRGLPMHACKRAYLNQFLLYHSARKYASTLRLPHRTKKFHPVAEVEFFFMIVSRSVIE